MVLCFCVRITSMATEKIKRLTLDIPESLHTALKVEAAKQGTSMNQLIEGWIRKHLPSAPPRKN